jgi:hypothetical protein
MCFKIIWLHIPPCGVLVSYHIAEKEHSQLISLLKKSRFTVFLHFRMCAQSTL